MIHPAYIWQRLKQNVHDVHECFTSFLCRLQALQPQSPRFHQNSCVIQDPGTGLFQIFDTNAYADYDSAHNQTLLESILHHYMMGYSLGPERFVTVLLYIKHYLEVSATAFLNKLPLQYLCGLPFSLGCCCNKLQSSVLIKRLRTDKNFKQTDNEKFNQYMVRGKAWYSNYLPASRSPGTIWARCTPSI